MAITFIDKTLTSSGRLAMYNTAAATCDASKVGSTRTEAEAPPVLGQELVVDFDGGAQRALALAQGMVVGQGAKPRHQAQALGAGGRPLAGGSGRPRRAFAVSRCTGRGSEAVPNIWLS